MAGPLPVPPFADKTYAIVDGESDDIVAWSVDQSSGEDTFVIKDSTVFQDKILPRFFNHCNFSSFTRQLNNYGFTKVRSPTSAEAASGGARGGRSEAETSWWEFKHPHFRRGRRELLGEIKRREDKRAPSSSGTSARSQSAAAAERKTEGTSDHVLRGVRGELEHMKRDLQVVDRKLDELKNLVVQLLLRLEQRPEALTAVGIGPGTAASGIGLSSTSGAPHPQQSSPKPQEAPPLRHRGHEREQVFYHLHGLMSSGSEDRSEHFIRQPRPQHEREYEKEGDVQQSSESREQLLAPSPRSRKRSLGETHQLSFEPSHRHGSLGQLISAPERGRGSEEGDRGGRIGGGREGQDTGAFGASATVGTAASAAGKGYGHWPRARPGGTDAKEPHNFQRRRLQQYAPVTTGRPPTPPYRIPSPLPPRDARGKKFTDSAEAASSELARPPWALSLPSPLSFQQTQQARLPFSAGEDDPARGRPASSPASSEAEEKGSVRSARAGRQPDGGGVGDQRSERSGTIRRRSVGDEAGSEVGSRRGSGGSQDST